MTQMDRAILTKAQAHINAALAADNKPIVSDNPFFDGLQPQDALIEMRAAYWTLANYLYPRGAA